MFVYDTWRWLFGPLKEKECEFEKFAKTLFVTKDGKEVKFLLNKEQKKLYQFIKEGTMIIPKFDRQSGVTSTLLAYAYWQCLKSETPIVINYIATNFHQERYAYKQFGDLLRKKKNKYGFSLTQRRVKINNSYINFTNSWEKDEIKRTPANIALVDNFLSCQAGVLQHLLSKKNFIVYG